MIQIQRQSDTSSQFSPLCRFIADSMEKIRAEPTLEPSSVPSPTQISFQDIGNISRLTELVASLRRGSEEGTELFRQIFGSTVDPFHPGPQDGWSYQSFSELGLHSCLASPAYYRHRTIKGVVFLDLDDTQTNFKRCSPHAALDRALFLIEMAQKGVAIVTVTGSSFTGGDPRHSIENRIASGELFMTPLMITNGGSEARVLVGDRYEQVMRYQREVERVRRERGGNWQQLHDDFVRIAENIINSHLAKGWSTKPEAVIEFNERSISTKRIDDAIAEVPPIMVQRYTPLEGAERNGRIHFYITLPAEIEQARTIITEIDREFKECLQGKGVTGIASFPGFQQSFGIGEHVIQFSYDIGSISKEIALRALNCDLERAFGIPLDVKATISFGGDGSNDVFFLNDFDENVRRQAPGLLNPKGKFLIQPGFEQQEVAAGVKKLWPQERVVILSNQHGQLWCERLRAGYDENSHILPLGD